ncbi:hypothetical protein [Chryseosolibacter indicus]|uniref:Uncharacterized protein n=1 Tax=Chryseosolibacter indicus TaxID=2782351 RepID=A0ABS5VWB6_9BACT|nr:hypothetical protein [Chryseosolibacter indicus]MBT1705521.1 hypothetical protein [Chryseosolibacter indicus]
MSSNILILHPPAIAMGAFELKNMVCEFQKQVESLKDQVRKGGVYKVWVRQCIKEEGGTR